jgi:hypothetical protein
MAGSVTQTVSRTRNGDLRVWTVNLAWIGASSGGTVSNVAFSQAIMDKIQGLYLFRARTIPGAGPPTANYDVTVLDEDSVDVLGGVLMNRSNTLTETVVPIQDTSANLYGPVYVGTNLTLVIGGTTVNSAAGTIRLYFTE